jgi:hypothetical protein
MDQPFDDGLVRFAQFVKLAARRAAQSGFQHAMRYYGGASPPPRPG